jgi:hypothetical protein
MSMKSKAKKAVREAFKLSRFVNPSGQIVWRVSGMKQDGTRVRQNFKREDEAAAQRQALEVETLNFAHIYQAVHNHEGLTAEWAGNSVAVVRKHYRRAIKPADAASFWAIYPNSDRTGNLIDLSQQLTLLHFAEETGFSAKI